MSAVTARLRAWATNPVLRRELLERWRGRRAFVVLTVYTVLLTGIYLLLYWLAREFVEDRLRFGGFAGFSVGPMIGRFLFENLLAFVLLLVLFIGPGYAAAQISGERERKTLSLLQITLVRPSAIVAGKLGASVAWMVLLVVAALPLGAVAFFLGGVSLADLARGLVMILVVAVSVAALGIGISSATRRTTASVIITYAAVLALVLGSLFAAVVESVAVRSWQNDTRPVSLYANPFYGLADAVRANTIFSGDELPSVLSPFAAALPDSFRAQVAFEEEVVVGDGPGIQPMEREIGAQDLAQPTREPVWLKSMAIYAALGLLGWVMAAHRVKPGQGPKRKDRRRDDEREQTSPPPPPPPPSAGEPPFVNP
ncbi:MAG: ABC transporter permease [Nitriliruptorales bacterium]|nr:ABC transporter permease [Nitriliruptorales bacterium]